MSLVVKADGNQPVNRHFLINGPNVGGPVVTDVIAAQSRYIARCPEYAGEADAGAGAQRSTVRVKPEAFDAYNADVQRRAAASVLVRGGCTTWYRTANGTGEVFSHWPGTIASLRDALDGASREDLLISA